MNYLIYIMNCIFVTPNVRLTDELAFSLMNSSSTPKLLKLILTVFINFFLLFFVQCQSLHILSQAPDLLFHHLTLHTVSDIHIIIYIFSVCTCFKQLFVTTTYSLCTWIRKVCWLCNIVYTFYQFINFLLPLCNCQNLLQLPQPHHHIKHFG